MSFNSFYEAILDLFQQKEGLFQWLYLPGKGNLLQMT